MRISSKTVKSHLQKNFPEIRYIFKDEEVIKKFKTSNLPLPEAVVKTITSQILSSKSASKICAKIKNLA